MQYWNLYSEFIVFLSSFYSLLLSEFFFYQVEKRNVLPVPFTMSFFILPFFLLFFSGTTNIFDSIRNKTGNTLRVLLIDFLRSTLFQQYVLSKTSRNSFNFFINTAECVKVVYGNGILYISFGFELFFA